MSKQKVVTQKAAQFKKDIVKKCSDMLKEYPIIGVLNMANLPAAQLNQMKKKLKGQVKMYMARKTLINLAIDEAKGSMPGLEGVREHFKEMPALLFTKENPFALYKTIKKSKSNAPAKPGQIAPVDIWIKEGPTPFGPGPIISEFAKLGIQAGVVEGKVAVKQDSLACKEGEEISGDLASMMAKLGIEPMEIGLDLVAVYEAGTIYTRKTLDIDEEQFEADLMSAASKAFNLAVEAAIPTSLTTELLLSKAFRQGISLAKESAFLADAVVQDLVEQAEREMLSLKSTANIPETAPAEEPKEEPAAEEGKTEDNKEEASEESKQEEAPEEKSE